MLSFRKRRRTAPATLQGILRALHDITPTPRTRALVAAALLLLATVGCGPVVMIPGGALDGEDTTPPADWAFTDAVDTVQLETRPDDPYSVNIWCVAADGRLFVAGSRESTWTQNVAADPLVKLRVDGKLYALRAREATTDADVEAFVTAAAAKYGFEMEPGQREESILFELSPR